MSATASFPTIVAIFYSEFHPVQGPRVIFEVPDGFVGQGGVPASAAAAANPSTTGLTGHPGTSPSTTTGTLKSATLPANTVQGMAGNTANSTAFASGTLSPPPSAGSIGIPQPPELDYDELSEYIIPKSDLCDKLITLRTDRYKVLGYPVSIVDRKYERNALLFNLAFVFDQDAETGSYEPVVRKMARVLRNLETESEFVSNVSTRPYLQNIIEQLIEDLNSYCECQIPIDDANCINLKLFPMYGTPPAVFDWQVPVYIVDLGPIDDVDWDMSMRKVARCINGVTHVKKIAQLADVDPALTRNCVQHLLYYGCIALIDIFQFSNVYAVRPEIIQLVSTSSHGDQEMVISQHALGGDAHYQYRHHQSCCPETCPAGYSHNHGFGVYDGGLGMAFGQQSPSQLQLECRDYVAKPNVAAPSFAKIFGLYCALKHGVTVKEWVIENQVEALGIDVRFAAFCDVRCHQGVPLPCS